MNKNGVCLATLLLLLGACGDAPGPKPNTSNDVVVSASSGQPIEQYFPIVNDHLWTYDVTSDVGEQSSFIVRARRTKAAEGELQTPRGTKRFAYLPDGIGLLDRHGFVLKQPLAVGTTWRGEHGGISHIETVGAIVSTTAGRFVDCIVTIEERGGDVRATYTTTFCPNVGIVLLEVEAGLQHERAELRSYGPPVSIGPSGTTLTKPE